MKQLGKTVTVTRTVGETTEERVMSAIQWQNIGSNEATNGGWKVAKPTEAKPSEKK